MSKKVTITCDICDKPGHQYNTFFVIRQNHKITGQTGNLITTRNEADQWHRYDGEQAVYLCDDHRNQIIAFVDKLIVKSNPPKDHETTTLLLPD